jgi:hypothetical protein
LRLRRKRARYAAAVRYFAFLALFANTACRPTPVDPTGHARDRFGVLEVYPTAGRQWTLPDDAQAASSEWDPDGAVSATGEAGVFSVTGSPRTNVLSPMGAAWWRNVEMTGYVRVDSTLTGGDQVPHWEWYARGERHTSNDTVDAAAINHGVAAPYGTVTWPGYPFTGTVDQHCFATAYHGNLYLDGRVHLEREISHTDGYGMSARDERYVANFPTQTGRWIGLKLVVRNEGTSVHLEVYVDVDGDRWVKSSETWDRGDWPARTTTLDGCTAAPFGYTPTTPITWAGPWASFRSDNLVYSLKQASVREIAPIP